MPSPAGPGPVGPLERSIHAVPASGTTTVPGVERQRGPDDREELTRRLFHVVHTSNSSAEAAAAREQIVRLHMDMARSLTRRYTHRGIAAEDLEQVAYLTLTKIVDSFDLDKGQDFIAFAVPSIRGALKRHFRDRGWTVRPPRRIQELQPAIRRATEDLQQQLNRSPLPTELAEHLQTPLADVIEALAADTCFHPTSLDHPLGPRNRAGRSPSATVSAS